MLTLLRRSPPHLACYSGSKGARGTGRSCQSPEADAWESLGRLHRAGLAPLKSIEDGQLVQPRDMRAHARRVGITAAHRASHETCMFAP